MAPHAPLTPDVRESREMLWGILALGYAIRGVCALLLVAVFGTLVRGQRLSVDASMFE